MGALDPAVAAAAAAAALASGTGVDIGVLLVRLDNTLTMRLGDTRRQAGN